MLHTKTVDSTTLELIKVLQKKEYLKGFYLAGGTALALYIGHRKSVDINLFSDFSFDAEWMIENIRQDFNFQLFNTAANTLKGMINGINVDIISHRYPLISEVTWKQDIYLFGIQDIIAMKMNAISVSGQRTKDFVDIYFLLEQYSISDMLVFYKTKYGQESDSHILKSLIYFDDVDLADWPVVLVIPSLKWSEVKKRIEKKVLQYLRNSLKN